MHTTLIACSIVQTLWSPSTWNLPSSRTVDTDQSTKETTDSFYRHFFTPSAFRSFTIFEQDHRLLLPVSSCVSLNPDLASCLNLDLCHMYHALFQLHTTFHPPPPSFRSFSLLLFDHRIFTLLSLSLPLPLLFLCFSLLSNFLSLFSLSLPASLYHV